MHTHTHRIDPALVEMAVSILEDPEIVKFDTPMLQEMCVKNRVSNPLARLYRLIAYDDKQTDENI